MSGSSTEAGAEQGASVWWQSWRDEDYSWPGLARKKLAGGKGPNGEKTLQDYWRRDPETGVIRDDEALTAAGELAAAPDGRLWHIVHTPLTWQDGASTWKSDLSATQWKQIRDLLSKRFGAAQSLSIKTSTDEKTREHVDGRAQLQGAVIDALWDTLDSFRQQPPRDGKTEQADADDEPTLNAVMTRVYFGARPYFSRLRFGASLDLSRSFFQSGATFVGADFIGNASFASVIFRGHAFFWQSKFRGDADFSKAQFQSADFEVTTFEKDLTLTEAIFERDAEFRRAQIAGALRASNTEFRENAYFVKVSVKGPASFYATRIHKRADFEGVRFLGDASFEWARLDGSADFDDSQFAGDASFGASRFGDLARFNKAEFKKKAAFEESTFSGVAGWTYATFSEDATFTSCSFSRKAFFNYAKFLAGARVDHVSFDAKVVFGGVSFRGNVCFHQAVFGSIADFAEATLPTLAKHYHGAFRGAHFRQQADFFSQNFTQFAAFDGARIEQGILLDSGEARIERHFHEALRAIDQAARSDREEIQKPGYDPKEDLQENYRGRERRLTALEGGLRALKQTLAAQGDRYREQLFYRYELIVRRRHPRTRLFEKFASWLYAATSDYGNSIFRPFASLLVCSLLFAGLFLGWFASLALIDDGSHTPVDGDWWSAFEFSLRNIFRPFSVWNDEDIGGWLRRFADAAGPGGWIGIRFAASFESALALILLFLFGLGVRRKFQIT